MTRAPYAPAVIVHAFFHAADACVAGSPARECIEQLWARAADKGFRGSTGDGPLELTPCNRSPQALVVLAESSLSRFGRIDELIVYQDGDVVGVSILEAVSEGRQPWDMFDLSWLDRLSTARDGLIGAVLIHHGLARGGASERALRAFTQQLPGQPERNRPVSVWQPRSRVLVAELPVQPGAPAGTRRLYAVASQRDEDVLEQWLWHSPVPGRLPVATSYLLDAARLRQQYDVLLRQQPAIRALADTVDALGARLRPAVRSGAASLASVRDAEDALRELRDAQSRLVKFLADIGTVTVTVRALARNLDDLANTSGGAQFVRALGDQAVNDLEVETGYLEQAQRNADETGRIVASVVDGILQRRDQNEVLLASAVVGAMAMGLGAIQALEYHVPWPHRLFAPIICLSSAVALALPFRVVRLLRGAAYERRLAVLGVIFDALGGLAFGWLVASCFASSTRLTWFWAGVGGLQVAVVAAYGLRRRDRLVTASAPHPGGGADAA